MASSSLAERSIDLVTVDPIEDTTRREFIHGVGAAALAAAFLAACGEDDNNIPSPTPTPTASTRTVETAHGPVEIPTDAATFICVDNYTPLVLLDVGVAPAGVIDIFQGPAAGTEHQAAFDTIPVIGGWMEYDLETITAMQPDVILGVTMMDEFYETLSEIAPTAFFATPEQGDDWKTLCAVIADVAGKVDENAALRTEYQALALEVQERHADVLASTRWNNLWTFDPAEFTLFSPHNPSGAVMLEAGVQFGSATDGVNDTYITLSSEQLNVLSDSDVLLVYDEAALRDEVSSYTEELFALPPWQALPAVQADNVYLHATSAQHYRAAMTMLGFIDDVASDL